MRINSIVLIVLFFAVVIFPSCNKPANPKAIASLDSLKILVDKAGEELEKMDARKADSCYKNIQRQLKFIQQNYRDTMTKAVAMFLSDYHAIKEPLEMLSRNYTELKRQVTYTSNQLKNLSHDLQHNLVEKEKITTYIETEMKEAERLIETANSLIDEAEEQFPKYDKLQPRVQHLVDSLMTLESKK